MFRLVLVLALVAGVAHVEAAPERADRTDTRAGEKRAAKQRAKQRAKRRAKQRAKRRAKQRAKQRAKRRAKQRAKQLAKRKADAKKSRARRKRRRKARYVPRKPTRRVLATNKGMPRGFSWPPTRAMLAAEKECEGKLDRAGVVWERAEAEGRMASPIYVRSMTFGGIKYANQWGRKSPPKMDCQLALALETIGPELHAIGVREIRYGSVFRWTLVRSHGKTRKILSRHGLGLAMDIPAFIDETGRVVKVKDDYPREDRLLLAIEQVVNASDNFRILLTPRNDPVSHDDHFHIEARSDFTSHEVP